MASGMKQKPQYDTLVIIPVFNEEGNIKNLLDQILENSIEADILIVDDGSTDNSREVIAGKKVFYIRHIFNLGIGASFETGCKFALERGYEYIVRIDGDGQHSPVFIKDMLQPLEKGEADIVIGSRFLGNSEIKSSRCRLIGIYIISLLLKLLTKKEVTDPTSGFCAMNVKAFNFFSSHSMEDYPEPAILMYHRYFRIKEIPIVISMRDSGTSSITPLKSVYYMCKVILSLCMDFFRKE